MTININLCYLKTLRGYLHTVHHTVSKKNAKNPHAGVPLHKIFNDPNAQISEAKELNSQIKEANVTVIWF